MVSLGTIGRNFREYEGERVMGQDYGGCHVNIFRLYRGLFGIFFETAIYHLAVSTDVTQDQLR